MEIDIEIINEVKEDIQNLKSENSQSSNNSLLTFLKLFSIYLPTRQRERFENLGSGKIGRYNKKVEYLRRLIYDELIEWNIQDGKTLRDFEIEIDRCFRIYFSYNQLESNFGLSLEELEDIGFELDIPGDIIYSTDPLLGIVLYYFQSAGCTVVGHTNQKKEIDTRSLDLCLFAQFLEEETFQIPEDLNISYKDWKIYRKNNCSRLFFRRVSTFNNKTEAYDPWIQDIYDSNTEVFEKGASFKESVIAEIRRRIKSALDKVLLNSKNQASTRKNCYTATFEHLNRGRIKKALKILESVYEEQDNPNNLLPRLLAEYYVNENRLIQGATVEDRYRVELKNIIVKTSNFLKENADFLKSMPFEEK